MADQALVDEVKRLSFRLQQLRCLYVTVDGCHQGMIRAQLDHDLRQFDLLTKTVSLGSIFEGPPPPRMRNKLYD
jgi:hypothetical protein